jgi:hypothetical protein
MIQRFLPNNQYNAALNANAPSAANPFTTVSDLSGVGFAQHKVLWVTPSGDDNTAATGNFNKPFQTPLAAKNVAASGDTIVLMPGAYTTNTNLAKDGVNYHAWKGSSIVKSTAGAMFDVGSGFALPTNITGHGSYIHGGSVATAGGIYKTAWVGDQVCEAFNMLTTDGFCMELGAQTHIQINVSFARARGANKCVLQPPPYNTGNTHININSVYWTSDSWNVIGGGWWTGNIIANGAKWYAPNGYCVAQYDGVLYGTQPNVFNVASLIGQNYAFATQDFGGGLFVINCAYCSGINNPNSTSFILNGFFNKVINAGHIKGGYIAELTNSGTVETTMASNFTSYTQLINTGGIAKILIPKTSYIAGWSVTGGVVELDYAGAIQWYAPLDRTVNGGTLIIKSVNIFCNPDQTPTYFTKLISGKIILDGQARFGVNGNFKMTRFIEWTGGDIIVKNFILDQPDAKNLPISAQASGLKLKNFGRLNTSHEEFVIGDEVFYTNKIMITAVASTSFNAFYAYPSGVIETVSEADATTYNTRALLAQRLVSKINSTWTQMTAYQDNDGADEYFYIKNNLSNRTTIVNAPVNVTSEITNINSQAFTIVGGGEVYQDFTEVKL